MPDVFSLASTAKAIHDSIDEAFATVPADRQNVFIFDGSYSQKEGAAGRFVYARRVGRGWSIINENSVDRDHGFGTKVGTIKSW